MNKVFAAIATLLLLLATTAAAQTTTSERFGFRSVNDPAYGAVCGSETTGTTGSDHTAFAAAMSAASSAGGGTVYVPACASGEYYYFSTALSVPSNVTLLCQTGAEFRQPTNAVVTPAVTGGTSLVGFYGVSNAGIDGCRIDSTDVATASNQANPIEIGPATPWTGTRSDGVTVQNTTILANSHSAGPYLIWARLADNVRILNNTLDGGQTSNATSDQNGIEFIAVTNAVARGNTLTNIGNYGLVVAAYGTGTFADYQSENVFFVDNDVNVSKYGIGITPSVDGAANVAYLKNIVVSNNRVKDPWLIGIHVSMGTQPGSLTAMYRNVAITGNVVDASVLTNEPYGMGINFGGTNTTADGFTVTGNTFYGGKGSTSSTQTGLRLTYVKNVTFTGNHWSGGDVTMANAATASQAVPVVVITASSATADVTFIGNYFGQAAGSAVWNGVGGDNYIWVGNTFDGWQATTSAQPPAINMAGGSSNRWIVTGNKFIRGAGAEGYLLQGTIASNDGWIWRDNLMGGTTGFNYQACGLWCGAVGVPAGASGASAGTVADVNSNSHGAFRLEGDAGAYTSVTVTNAQVRPGSRIAVTQIAGSDILAYKVVPGSGSFVLTTTSDPAADMDFFYEIFN